MVAANARDDSDDLKETLGLLLPALCRLIDAAGGSISIDAREFDATCATIQSLPWRVRIETPDHNEPLCGQRYTFTLQKGDSQT